LHQQLVPLNRNSLFCGNVRSTRLHPDGCSRKQPVLYVSLDPHCMPVVHSSETVQYAVRIMFADSRHGVSYRYPKCCVVLVTVFCVATLAQVLSALLRAVRPSSSNNSLAIFLQGTFGNTRLVVVTLWLCADPAPLWPQLTL
jgi:hypothetical protein